MSEMATGLMRRVEEGKEEGCPILGMAVGLTRGGKEGAGEGRREVLIHCSPVVHTDTQYVLYIFLSAAVTMTTVAPTGSDSIKNIVVASIIGSCSVVVFTVLLVCGLLYCLCQLGMWYV